MSMELIEAESILNDLATRVTAETRVLIQEAQADPEHGLSLVTMAYPELVQPYLDTADQVGQEFYMSQPGGSASYRPTALEPVVSALGANARWMTLNPDPANTAGVVTKAVFGSFRDSQAVNAAIEHGVPSVLSRVNSGVVNRELLSYVPDGGYETLWARMTHYNACQFCKILETRDPVYGSAKSALGVVGRGAKPKPRGRQALGSKYHDHCRCSVVPVRPGESYHPLNDSNDEWMTWYAKAVEKSQAKYGEWNLDYIAKTLEHQSDMFALPLGWPTEELTEFQLRLNAAKSPKEVAVLMNNKYDGIDRSVRWDPLDWVDDNTSVEAARDIAISLDGMLEKYSDKTTLNSVGIVDQGPHGPLAFVVGYDPSGSILNFNSYYLKPNTARESLDAAASSGWFRINDLRREMMTPWRNTVVHEFGHTIDNSDHWRSDKVAPEVFSYLYRKAEQTTSAVSFPIDNWAMLHMSGYARHNSKNGFGYDWREVFAEAFADVQTNGAAANMLSREIVNEMFLQYEGPFFDRLLRMAKTGKV